MDDPFQPRRGDASPEAERIGALVVDTGYRLHRELGPSLRERHYARFLEHGLQNRGLRVARETRFPLTFEGLTIEGALRTDIIVDDAVLVEVKATEQPLAVHEAQVLSYLRHTGLELAYLINFRSPYYRSGVRRYIHRARASPALGAAFPGP